MNSMIERSPQGESEKPLPRPVREIKQFLSEGESMKINDTGFRILEVRPASDVAEEFGLSIRRQVPVYYLEGVSPGREGAYHPELDCILIFANAREDTLRHELIHAIEFPQEKRPGLLALYERARRLLSEDSFTEGGTSFNFRKNISEFIADGYTKDIFMQALKKEDPYEDFLRETAYLFD
jgi:hypothetical protein